MSKRSPKSVSEKLEIVLLHLEEGKSLSWLTRNQGISKDTLSNWVRKYKEAGVDGLEESRQWKKYSKELKEQAVSDYLNGLGSLKDLTKKYGISDPYVLRSWIKSYTSGKELKATSKGMRRMKTANLKNLRINIRDMVTDNHLILTSCLHNSNDTITILKIVIICFRLIFQIKAQTCHTVFQAIDIFFTINVFEMSSDNLVYLAIRAPFFLGF